MTDTKVNSIIETSAFDPEARIDPHSKLKQMRGACPIFEEDSTTSMVMRYADVKETVNDRSMWRHPTLTQKGALARAMIDDDNAAPEDMSPGILFLDEPDHSRIRLPLAKAFYARVNKMKAEIDWIIDDVIDGAPDTGHFDLIDEIAIPIPILVIAKVLGVEANRIREFREWSEAAILRLNPVRTPEQTNYMEWGQGKLEEHFTELMELRREKPLEDLISDMITVQAEGAPLTDEEIRTNLGGLLIGGNLTTTDLIGNGMWLLLTHPEQLAKLKEDSGLATSTVEEILRYESPVAITTRVIPDNREIGGCPMEPHHSVFMSLHSANRDPDVFDDPDEFNISPREEGHVAFGGGSHICIGSPLARIEAKRVFARLFERYPDMELVQEEISWRMLPFFRGIEELKIKV